jgi:hypothetical protein
LNPHVYANSDNVTPGIIESIYALTKRKGARYLPAAFLTGLPDPVQSQEEFLELFAWLEGKIPVLVVSTKGSPKRSKAKMEALRGACNGDGVLRRRWGSATEIHGSKRDVVYKKKKKKKEKKRGMHTWVARRMQWEFDWGRGIRGRKGFS